MVRCLTNEKLGHRVFYGASKTLLDYPDSGGFYNPVTSTYLLFAPEVFSLSKEISYSVGGVITVFAAWIFYL